MKKLNCPMCNGRVFRSPVVKKFELNYKKQYGTNNRTQNVSISLESFSINSFSVDRIIVSTSTEILNQKYIRKQINCIYIYDYLREKNRLEITIFWGVLCFLVIEIAILLRIRIIEEFIISKRLKNISYINSTYIISFL